MALQRVLKQSAELNKKLFRRVCCLQIFINWVKNAQIGHLRCLTQIEQEEEEAGPVHMDVVLPVHLVKPVQSLQLACLCRTLICRVARLCHSAACEHRFCLASIVAECTAATVTCLHSSEREK